MFKLLNNESKQAYTLNEYIMEKLDDEIILYLTTENKVLSMNETASYIWGELVHANTLDSVIDEESIINGMMKFFKYDASLSQTVACDIKDIIGMLINSNAIIDAHDTL